MDDKPHTPLTLAIRETLSDEENEYSEGLALEIVSKMEGMPMGAALLVMELLLGAMLTEELSQGHEEGAINVVGLMAGLLAEAYTIATYTVGHIADYTPKDLLKTLRDIGIDPPK